MADLSRDEKGRVIARDRSRCLRCGRRPSTFQHRRAIGMGGVGATGPPLTPADGCGLCLDCNVGAEGSLQDEALNRGWKIRTSSSVPSREIPYYDAMTDNWWLPDDEGEREWIPADRAVRLVARGLAG